MLFFSGKTVHGGGANVTADSYRRALSFALNPSFLTGEEAYPNRAGLNLSSLGS